MLPCGQLPASSLRLLCSSALLELDEGSVVENSCGIGRWMALWNSLLATPPAVFMGLMRKVCDMPVCGLAIHVSNVSEFMVGGVRLQLHSLAASKLLPGLECCWATHKDHRPHSHPKNKKGLTPK